GGQHYNNVLRRHNEGLDIMHPREGWQPDDTPPITDVSRRSFLRSGAGATGLAALGAGGLGSILAACSSQGPATSGAGGGTLPLPRPDKPVTWPIFNDNKPIANGLQPEKGATLRLFNWVAYINQGVLKNFCKKYNCNYQITNFQNMDT